MSDPVDIYNRVCADPDCTKIITRRKNEMLLRFKLRKFCDKVCSLKYARKQISESNLWRKHK